MIELDSLPYPNARELRGLNPKVLCVSRAQSDENRCQLNYADAI